MNAKEVAVDHSQLEFVNRPFDAPTIYVDGIRGITVSPDGAKLSLFETMADPASGQVLARFVATLAMTPAQLKAISAHLAKVVADGEARVAQVSPPSGGANE